MEVVTTQLSGYFGGEAKTQTAFVKALGKGARAIEMFEALATMQGLALLGPHIQRAREIRGIIYSVGLVRDIPLLLQGKLLKEDNPLVINYVSLAKIIFSICWLGSSLTPFAHLKKALPYLGMSMGLPMTLRRGINLFKAKTTPKEKLQFVEGVLDSFGGCATLYGSRVAFCAAGALATSTHLVHYMIPTKE